MLLILAAVVLIAIVVAIVGAMTGERPALPTAAAAVVGGGALVLVALVALVIGRGSSEPDDHVSDEAVVEAEPKAQPATTEVLRRPVDLVIGTANVGAGFGATGAVLDALADRQTRLVAVATSAPVIIRACVVGRPGVPQECAAGTPAGPIDHLAVGLVELRRLIEVPSGRVDCAVERCALVATVPNGKRDVGAVPLIFGRNATVPTVHVRPTRGLRPGKDVEVRVTGLSPHETISVTWCRPPGLVEPDACGPPAPALELRADENGGAMATLEVPRRARCGPRSRCAVAVVGAIVSPAPVEVGFARVPGPDLATGQLVAGLGGALVLALAAAWLMRRRDDEHPDDPFWGVSLDVPEWEGIDITIDVDELAGA
jgi:hypothetical protein